MRTYRTNKGPFAERPFFTQADIERICIDELDKVSLMPNEPSPIRIERFIEKRFGVSPVYEDIPAGVLGYTRFGPKGVEAVIVSRQLEQDTDKVAQRRVSTTLAHESGHGLLHAHLFALSTAADVQPLFNGELEKDVPRILCRDESVAGGQNKSQRQYDGRWWELQANQVMGALLLPRELVLKALEALLAARGAFGEQSLEEVNRERAAQELSRIFDVNPVVARIRLGHIFPPEEAGQLTF